MAEVARQLGVPEGRLLEWKRTVRERGPAAYPVSGHRTPLGEENRRSRAGVKRPETERDVLKSETAYFATQGKCHSPGSRNAAPSTRWPRCVACRACRGRVTTPAGPAHAATPGVAIRRPGRSERFTRA